MKFLSLLLLIATITYSQAATLRSANDIKKYEEFLRKSINGKPEAPLSPELENIQPAWERSGKFEGDIILTEEQIQMLVDEYAGKKNGVLDKKKLWPDAEVIYDIDTDVFEPEHVKAIETAIAYIEDVSCLTFRKKTGSDESYIYVQEGSGCSATVGYQGKGAQNLKLKPNNPGSGCFREFTIVHEFLHALGFHHMQSTYNRDDYVDIIWDNIEPDHEHNFEKYSSSQVTLLGTEYDYGSVLHYSSKAFAIDPSKDTIVALKSTTEQMGQREKMSDSDIIRLNKLYECPERKPKF